jgi:2-succinyl-6-hydroxy-2,4-cyclohexadiene-1-carboxylate synthase
MESANRNIGMRYLEHSGIRYACHQLEGIKPSIHALHGFLGTGLDYSLLAKHLPNQVEAWDLIGHGHTSVAVEEENYGLTEQLAFLKQAIPKGSILMGYSMGGRLALQFACHYPEHLQGLILVSSTPGIHSDEDRNQRVSWDQHMADQVLDLGMDSFLELWNKLPIIQSQSHIDPEHRKHMLNLRRLQSVVGISNSMRFFGAGTMTSCWEMLTSLDIPVLLIVGEQDEKYRDLALTMFDMLDNASLGVIPQAGHCAHLENPAATAILIRRWLKDLYSSGQLISS